MPLEGRQLCQICFASLSIGSYPREISMLMRSICFFLSRPNFTKARFIGKQIKEVCLPKRTGSDKIAFFIQKSGRVVGVVYSFVNTEVSP